MTHPWVLPKNKHSLTQKPATCSCSVHSDRWGVCSVPRCASIQYSRLLLQLGAQLNIPRCPTMLLIQVCKMYSRCHKQHSEFTDLYDFFNSSKLCHKTVSRYHSMIQWLNSIFLNSIPTRHLCPSGHHASYILKYVIIAAVWSMSWSIVQAAWVSF